MELLELFEIRRTKEKAWRVGQRDVFCYHAKRGGLQNTDVQV